MADIFLSYVRRDKERVAPIVKRLRAEGFDVWWDDDIPPDAPWEITIEDALRSARLTIVCWSEQALASENVRSEARWAKGQGKLIQLFLDSCDPPLFFGERQGIDLVGWHDQPDDPAFKRLVEKLGSAVAAPTKPDLAVKTVSRSLRLRQHPIAIGAAVLAVIVILCGALWLHGQSANSVGARVRVNGLKASAGDVPALLLRQGLATDLTRIAVGNDASLDFRDEDDGDNGPGKADYVVSGDVQSSGGTLRSTVKLVDAVNNTIIWSRGFSDDIGNVGALRLLMAQRVADVLICAFGSRSRRPAGIDLPTLKLFLAGCENYHTDWPAARRYFGDVVARRPDFAQARGMLAAALFWSTGTFSGLPRADWEPIRTQAYIEAEAAIAADKHVGSAYFVLAHRFIRPADVHKKLELLERGRREDPGSGDVALQLCDVLSNMGMNKAGTTECERAATLDPFSRLNAANLAESYAFGGRLADAQTVLEAARTSWHDDFYSSWLRFDIAARLQPPAAAMKILDAPMTNAGYHPAAHIQWRQFLAARADPAKAAGVAASIIAGAPALSPQGRLEAIQDLVQLDRVDEAMRLALALPPVGEAWNGRWFYDFMAPFRNDPRFVTIAERQGLIEAWKGLEILPDFCRDPGLKWKCPTSPAEWGTAAIR